MQRQLKQSQILNSGGEGKLRAMAMPGLILIIGGNKAYVIHKKKKKKKKKGFESQEEPFQCHMHSLWQTEMWLYIGTISRAI